MVGCKADLVFEELLAIGALLESLEVLAQDAFENTIRLQDWVIFAACRVHCEEVLAQRRAFRCRVVPKYM